MKIKEQTRKLAAGCSKHCFEVKDDEGSWRIILVSEAKHQGKDIENIRNGIMVGKDNGGCQYNA